MPLAEHRRDREPDHERLPQQHLLDVGHDAAGDVGEPGGLLGGHAHAGSPPRWVRAVPSTPSSLVGRPAGSCRRRVAERRSRRWDPSCPGDVHIRAVQQFEPTRARSSSAAAVTARSVPHPRTGNLDRILGGRVPVAVYRAVTPEPCRRAGHDDRRRARRRRHGRCRVDAAAAVDCRRPRHPGPRRRRMPSPRPLVGQPRSAYSPDVSRGRRDPAGLRVRTHGVLPIVRTCSCLGVCARCRPRGVAACAGAGRRRGAVARPLQRRTVAVVATTTYATSQPSAPRVAVPSRRWSSRSGCR